MIGGFGSYYSSQYFGKTWIVGAIFGGIAGLIGGLAGPPAGFLLECIGSKGSALGRLAGSAGLALLMPFFKFELLITAAVVGAVIGGLTFSLAEIPNASITVAFAPTFLGICIAGSGSMESTSNEF